MIIGSTKRSWWKTEQLQRVKAAATNIQTNKEMSIKPRDLTQDEFRLLS